MESDIHSFLLNFPFEQHSSFLSALKNDSSSQIAQNLVLRLVESFKPFHVNQSLVNRIARLVMLLDNPKILCNCRFSHLLSEDNERELRISIDESVYIRDGAISIYYDDKEGDDFEAFISGLYRNNYFLSSGTMEAIAIKLNELCQ